MPSTSKFVLIVAAPVIARVDPSKVAFASAFKLDEPVPVTIRLLPSFANVI